MYNAGYNNEMMFNNMKSLIVTASLMPSTEYPLDIHFI